MRTFSMLKCVSSAAVMFAALSFAPAHADNLPAAAAGDLVLAPIAFTTDATRLSYIRVANPGTTAGTVTAVIENAAGTVLGTWTKAAPANTSKQYGLDVIQKEANITPPVGIGRIEISSDFGGSIQHVVYNPGGGALTNVSNCGAQSISDVTTITNVHSSLITTFPSRVSIANKGTAGRAVLDVFDSETGVKVGTWTSPIIPAAGNSVFNVTDIQQQLGFTPNASQFHLTFKLQAGFNGALAHLVDNLQAGVLTDMTARCRLRAWTKINATTTEVDSAGSIIINASGVLKRNDGSRVFVWSGSTGLPSGLTCNPSPTRAARIDANGNVTSATAMLNETGPGPINAFKYVVGDFNKDGQDDFFSGNSGCDLDPYAGERQSLFLSTPTGYVDRSATLPQFDHYNHGADGADLRKSGNIDIIVNLRGMQTNTAWAQMHPGNNTTPDGRVGTYILRGNADGSFTYDNASLPDNIAGPYNYGLNDPRRRIATSAKFGDLNGDGYPDLIIGLDQENTSMASVFMNDGTGKFKTTEIRLPAGYFGASNNIALDVVVRDLNGDGRGDLIFTNTSWVPFYSRGRLQAMLSNADGTFTDASDTYFPGQGVNNVAAFRIHQVDLNGDGCDDLLLQADLPASGDVMAYKCGTDGKFSAYNVGAVRALSALRFDGRNVVSSATFKPNTSFNANRPIRVDVYEYK